MTSQSDMSSAHQHQSQSGEANGESVSPRVLNLLEAAKFVRCSRAHLCNIVNGKVAGIPRLPAVRIGRRVLFRRESLEQWLAQVENGAWRQGRA